MVRRQGHRTPKKPDQLEAVFACPWPWTWTAVQNVKPLLVVLTSHTGALVRLPAVLLPNQLVYLRRQHKAILARDQGGIPGWTNTGYCGHLGKESMDGRSVCPSLSFYYSVLQTINKQTNKQHLFKKVIHCQHRTGCGENLTGSHPGMSTCRSGCRVNKIGGGGSRGTPSLIRSVSCRESSSRLPFSQFSHLHSGLPPK